MDFKLSVLKKVGENAVIFALSGSLNTETHGELRAQVQQYLVKEKPKAVVLDLQALDYISSMGIGAIVEARRMTEAAGASFMMSNVPAHIDQVFRVVKALPNIRVFNSRQEADDYLMEIQKRAKGEA